MKRRIAVGRAKYEMTRRCGVFQRAAAVAARRRRRRRRRCCAWWLQATPHPRPADVGIDTDPRPNRVSAAWPGPTHPKARALCPWRPGCHPLSGSSRSACSWPTRPVPPQTMCTPSCTVLPYKTLLTGLASTEHDRNTRGRFPRPRAPGTKNATRHHTSQTQRAQSLHQVRAVRCSLKLIKLNCWGTVSQWAYCRNYILTDPTTQR